MNKKDFYKNYYSDIKLSEGEKKAMLNDLHNQLSSQNSIAKSQFFNSPYFKAAISFALSVCIITSAISYSQNSHRHDILINYNETTGTAIGHTAVSEYGNSENIINSDTSDYAYFETTDMDFYGTKETTDIYITDFFTDNSNEVINSDNITNITSVPVPDITGNSEFSNDKTNSESAVTTQYESIDSNYPTETTNAETTDLAPGAAYETTTYDADGATVSADCECTDYPPSTMQTGEEVPNIATTSIYSTTPALATTTFRYTTTAEATTYYDYERTESTTRYTDVTEITTTTTTTTTTIPAEYVTLATPIESKTTVTSPPAETSP